MVYFNDKYDDSLASNCGACGQEYLRDELRLVKLAGLNVKLCESCYNRDSADDFLSAIKELNELFSK